MRKRANPFQVTRAGAPIEDHAIKGSVNAGIQYSHKYSEFAACIAAGLDINIWQNLGYSLELKADLIAWWQLSGEIATHQQDAKNRKEAKLMKRRR